MTKLNETSLTKSPFMGRAGVPRAELSRRRQYHPPVRKFPVIPGDDDDILDGRIILKIVDCEDPLNDKYLYVFGRQGDPVDEGAFTIYSGCGGGSSGS